MLGLIRNDFFRRFVGGFAAGAAMIAALHPGLVA